MLRQGQGREGDPWARNRISDIALQTGLSIRQFERRFLEYTGVSPIVFARISRFEEALRLKATSSSESWTAIAHMLGYHDQMHMTRNFHVLAGDSRGRSINSGCARAHHECTHGKGAILTQRIGLVPLSWLGRSRRGGIVQVGQCLQI